MIGTIGDDAEDEMLRRLIVSASWRVLRYDR